MSITTLVTAATATVPRPVPDSERHARRIIAWERLDRFVHHALATNNAALTIDPDDPVRKARQSVFSEIAAHMTHLEQQVQA